MSWVSPIKDKETLQKFENGLKAAGEKYYVLFEIGLGTGLKMPDILGLRNEDVWEKEVLELNIGKKTIRRIFKIPENLQREILVYTEGKDPKAWLFPGRNGSKGPLSKEHACRVMKRVGEELGLLPVGSSTMRKTFAWNYYKATGDIFISRISSIMRRPPYLPLYRREAETDGKGRSAEPFPSGKGRQWEEADPAFGEHAGGDQRVLGRLGKKRCLFRQGGLSSDGNGRIDGKFQTNVKKRCGQRLIPLFCSVSVFVSGLLFSV